MLFSSWEINIERQQLWGQHMPLYGDLSTPKGIISTTCSIAFFTAGLDLKISLYPLNRQLVLVITLQSLSFRFATALGSVNT
jgi:hypothetical protein